MTAQTLNLTPTWTSTAAMLAMLFERGDDKGKAMAKEELMRMGSLLDDAYAAEKSEAEAVAEPAPDADVSHLNWVPAEDIADGDRYRYVSVCPEGYETILSYLARFNPWALKADLWDAEATQRDGFWCKHRATERGIAVVTVPAPRVLCDQGIFTVNAYPISLLQERLGD